MMAVPWYLAYCDLLYHFNPNDYGLMPISHDECSQANIIMKEVRNWNNPMNSTVKHYGTEKLSSGLHSNNFSLLYQINTQVFLQIQFSYLFNVKALIEPRLLDVNNITRLAFKSWTISFQSIPLWLLIQMMPNVVAKLALKGNIFVDFWCGSEGWNHRTEIFLHWFLVMNSMGNGYLEVPCHSQGGVA